MGLLSLGIILVLVGLVLAFTNLFGFAGLGGGLMWLGWILLAIGVILTIVHMVAGRRAVVYERRRGVL